MQMDYPVSKNLISKTRKSFYIVIECRYNCTFHLNNYNNYIYREFKTYIYAIKRVEYFTMCQIISNYNL